VCHEQKHCCGASSKHRAKVRVLSGKQCHITLPLSPSNSSDSLFNKSEAAQSEQSICDQKSKLALSSLWCLTSLPCLVSVLLVFSIMCFSVSIMDSIGTIMIHSLWWLCPECFIQWTGQWDKNKHQAPPFYEHQTKFMVLFLLNFHHCQNLSQNLW